MSAQPNSGKSAGIVSLTCAYLPQITAKLEHYPEPALQELDTLVSHYIQQRHLSRQPILKLLDEDSLDAGELNVPNLVLLRNCSQNCL